MAQKKPRICRPRRLGVIWLWLAPCRRTRQIVAYALGPRDDATAQLLWDRIPLAYRRSPLDTGHLESYDNILPANQHYTGYPKRGPTNHIGRFNNTLRQRLGHFVRKTLSFFVPDARNRYPSLPASIQFDLLTLLRYYQKF